MKIVLVGPPGSGKGSQAKKLEKEFSIPHISTGDIFRTLMKEDSELGRKVNEYMQKAMLVPDSITMQVVESYLTKNNFKNSFIFDGFPRTLYQAKALDEITKVDVVILLDTTLEVVSERILSRLVCSCGEVYNTKTYFENVCKVCGSKLKQRKDDNLETIKERFKEYENLTLPVVNYYKQQDRLITLDGSQSIETIFSKIKNILKSKI